MCPSASAVNQLFLQANMTIHTGRQHGGALQNRVTKLAGCRAGVPDYEELHPAYISQTP